jgi:hypothetical protein
MKIRIGLLAVAVAFLSACPGEQQAPPAFEEPAAPPVTEPIQPPAPVAPAAGTAQLEAVGASGVSGQVAAAPRNGRTEVTLTLMGAPANQSVGGRILSGTCESPGVEIARLDAVSTDAMGRGQSTTDVGHAPNLILDGNHVAAIYAPGSEPERDMPIACATLPGADMNTTQPTPGTNL